MPKVLFLTLHRLDRSPGQRFRHEQYLHTLSDNGFDITYSNLLNKDQDVKFYGSNGPVSKIYIGILTAFKRIKDLLRAKQFDIVFIYRDAYFFGTLFEKLFKSSGAKLIFDFDDSIWLMDENPGNSVLQKLKDPKKTDTIIRLCDLVIAGNDFLAKYAKKLNDNVTVIPTTIDTKEYRVLKKLVKDKIVIGWSGSFSTVKHFERAIPALRSIKKRYNDRLDIQLIGEQNFRDEYLKIQGKPWRKESELTDLCEFDIGIMPLPSDQWSEGKCGLKGLQYMALGIPTIMSPVGVNKDIIQDGENGFLASKDDEWVEKLTQLIENPDLRNKLGMAGRQTVVKKYSVDANKHFWLEAFQSVLK